jgi:putative SOS response-associated peptidase YedK
MSVGVRMINARAESLASKPAFRAALERRRCLIPADAWYEWGVVEAEAIQPRVLDEPSLGRRPDEPTSARSAGSTGPAKQPYAIGLASGEPMAMAGLWEVWRDPSGGSAELLRSCAIVTTAANESLAAIHPRMPAILPPEAWAPWLETSEVRGEEARALLVPAADELFRAWPVGTAVNKVTNEGPELLAEISGSRPRPGE